MISKIPSPPRHPGEGRGPWHGSVSRLPAPWIPASAGMTCVGETNSGLIGHSGESGNPAFLCVFASPRERETSGTPAFAEVTVEVLTAGAPTA